MKRSALVLLPALAGFILAAKAEELGTPAPGCRDGYRCFYGEHRAYGHYGYGEQHFYFGGGVQGYVNNFGLYPNFGV